MIDDIMKRYLKESMKSMNYGEIPEFGNFQRNFKRTVKGTTYNYELKGTDAKMAKKVGIPVEGDWTDKELYDIIKKLTGAWERGNDEAGDLASSIMETLDFEWI